jgi:hypothetical protein
VSTLHLLAFGWDPEIRGILFLLTAVIVLMGSVYLVLATNSGARLGLLIALATLMGWMTLMGAIWWVYGIGMRGTDPTWQPHEVVVGDLAQAELEDARSLDGWSGLAADDPGTGQAQAAADEILAEADAFQSPSEYQHLGVYDRGGETYPEWFFNVLHEPHYAIVNVQAVVPQEADPGQPPPRPVVDPEQPSVWVVMVRDLGDRRFPAAMITLCSGVIFAILINVLHRRDKALMRARTAESAT